MIHPGVVTPPGPPLAINMPHRPQGKPNYHSVHASQLNNRDLAILMTKYGGEILNTDPVIQSMPRLPPTMSRELLNIDPSIRAMALTRASQVAQPAQVGLVATIAVLVGLGLGIAGTLLLTRK